MGYKKLAEYEVLLSQQITITFLEDINMKHYLVENVKYGVTSAGTACGPVAGNAVASVEFKESNDSLTEWLSLVEVDGMTNFYLSDKEIFEELLKEDDDDEHIALLNSYYIKDFHGFKLSADYDEIFENIYEGGENDKSRLVRFLIAVVRADENAAAVLKESAKGKYIEDIEFTACDIEEEYLEQ